MIKNILSGWYNWAKFLLGIMPVREYAQALQRQAICQSCPFRKVGICTVCGCATTPKTFCKDCECPNEYWK